MTSRVLLDLILIIAALVLGIVAVIESAWKNWAGWAAIALAIAGLIMVWPK
jgi:hypothetical protein